MDLIRIKNVEKKYKNGVTAIYDLNLAIEKGSFVFVIGGSGSGKSTLIKMLYREEKPTKGQVVVGGMLSGGEQQRVAIARAIANNPKLLLCDEPTGNLDPEKSMEIMKVLEGINNTRGTTIIMATHDKEIVNKMKKQVITLKDGHLVDFKQKGTYNNEAN